MNNEEERADASMHSTIYYFTLITYYHTGTNKYGTSIEA